MLRLLRAWRRDTVLLIFFACAFVANGIALFLSFGLNHTTAGLEVWLVWFFAWLPWIMWNYMA